MAQSVNLENLVSVFDHPNVELGSCVVMSADDEIKFVGSVDASGQHVGDGDFVYMHPDDAKGLDDAPGVIAIATGQ